MTLLDFLRTIFRTETESEKLERFIVANNPQSVEEVEALTNRFSRQQTMQWFNNC